MSPVPFLTHPPTSFPLRELLLFERLPVRPEGRICEIGVGTGHTLVALATLGAEVTGLEISRPVVDSLRPLADQYANLSVFQADVTRDADVAPFLQRFSWVISSDTIEHVSDPAAFFRSLSRLLLPGGRFLVTFPNEPPDRMHGVTRFAHEDELSRLLEEAGLHAHQLGAARLRAGPARIANLLGHTPLRQVRRLLRRCDGAPAGQATLAQTFEETRFHRNAALWWRLSPAVNAYWYAVERLMTLGGPAFEVDWGFARSSFEDCQVVIVGCKRAEQALPEPYGTRLRPRPYCLAFC
jgi:SAM-dependent methyltransferase